MVNVYSSDTQLDVFVSSKLNQKAYSPSYIPFIVSKVKSAQSTIYDRRQVVL